MSRERPFSLVKVAYLKKGGGLDQRECGCKCQIYVEYRVNLSISRL